MQWNEWTNGAGVMQSHFMATKSVFMGIAYDSYTVNLERFLVEKLLSNCGNVYEKFAYKGIE